MKSYTCDCCFVEDISNPGLKIKKEWPSKTHLNRHLNTKKITGEPRKPQKVRCDKKDYNCDLCGKGFRNNWFLNKHLEVCSNKHRACA